VNRADALTQLSATTFDVLIIGGGATGLGAAVDAAARGYRTALIEADDFASATSSRSTKLVHGGVRYLQQGNIGLVREALHERAYLRANAPHLVDELDFVLPAYGWFDVPYYGTGLKAYDLLAGRTSFAPSRLVTARAARARIPMLRSDGLRAAIVYADGQFDDARLAIALARTAVDHGATVANYLRAEDFVYDGTRIAAVQAHDRETGRTCTIRARAVVNATGIFADTLRARDNPATPPLLTHSRGSHIVVAAAALGGPTAALLVPKTSDGRVLFAVPWHEHVVIGTTDSATDHAERNPVATDAEVAYILETINRYLARPLATRDVLATFAGLRPLVNRRAVSTAKLSREHVIDVSPSGLVTITGGKWTTYRKMAEDVIDVAAQHAGLPSTPSPTRHLSLHGASDAVATSDALRVYGTDASAVVALGNADAALAAPLDPRLPYTGAMVVYAARAEMARTVDDVLARRTRALVLDVAAARASAPAVAKLLTHELGRDAAWQEEQLRTFHILVPPNTHGVPSS
jgi:glycerol-3-phosphate dehydrogenase